MPLESWKTIFDWATIVFIALTVFTGAGALITGDKLGKRLEKQLQDFQLKLTAAQTELSQQQAKTLELQKELIAQGPRVNLLYGKTAETVILELKPFSGQRVEIRYSQVSFNQYHIDTDTMGVAMRLQSLLTQAGWDVAPALLIDNSNGAAIWVAIGSKASKLTTKAANSLLDALRGVPLKVNDKPEISDAPRPPQPQIFSQGKEVKLPPLTPETIVVTVLAHP